ncbi:PREDICTED: ly6/PLAUR domain-containing protein 8 [Chrysochloris asiatica]|uniref:Ly6/PLAUR domain-containing protein 8 n=1 Tax=Chrysochloris asiatica TaxID=185453 RepID=A0A9B0X0Y7_CHRAS|nr:PREDICTED: ly6/PLAUR domain-containing protein 8 [Chrysochloris asiatica]
MKRILIAGIIAVLTIVTVESLNCTQCNSLNNTCNSSTASQCSNDTNSSCTSSMVNSTLGGNITLYEDKSCSAEECSEEEKVIAAFTVHVSDGMYFQFASQCCRGDDCNTKNASAPSLEDELGNTVCPACYGSNETSCSVKQRKCYKEERCVDIVANFSNGINSKTLVLKGCSNVNGSTCQFLSASNHEFGGITFQKFDCVDNFTTLTPTPPKSTQTTTPNMGSKISLTPLLLASLLLFKLLL